MANPQLRSVALAALLIGAGCAQLPSLSISPSDYEQHRQMYARALDANHRVGVAAASICNKPLTPSLGSFMMIMTKSWGGLDGYGDYERQRLGPNADSSSISHVTKGSPADKAGIKPGDKLVSINGQKFGAVTTLRAGTETPIVLDRRGETVNVTLTPVASCYFPLIEQPLVNTADARAQGNRIQITYGMLQLTTRDTDLEFVLAHELCHNVLHLEAMKANKPSQRIELEADRCAVQIMANGAMNYRQVVDFLIRAETARPFWMMVDGAHPPLAERISALNSAIADVERLAKR